VIDTDIGIHDSSTAVLKFYYEKYVSWFSK